jgi:hypothetical protein
MKQRQATRHGQETKKKPFARDKERRPQNRTTRSIDSDVESEGLCRSSEQVERTGHLLLAFHTMLLIFGRSRIEHLPCARAHTHTKHMACPVWWCMHMNQTGRMEKPAETYCNRKLSFARDSGSGVGTNFLFTPSRLFIGVDICLLSRRQRGPRR